jgi:putative transposase
MFTSFFLGPLLALSERLCSATSQHPPLGKAYQTGAGRPLRFYAWVNFFEGRAEYPAFKKKQNTQSATYASNAFKWDGKALTLAKMKAPLESVWQRLLPKGCKPSSVTVSKDGANRYARLHPARRGHEAACQDEADGWS